jgi:ATP-dependent DNA helicase RecQ
MLTTTTWEQVLATFRHHWGYDHFRGPQGEIVKCLLEGQDTLVILPTGGGKSVCFQLPALLQSGLTLVVSPLVALMENQVQELKQRQLPAELLHSQLSSPQKQQILANLSKLRLLYLSPETLLSPKVWRALCQPTLEIRGLILDEAHCLVQWGDSFRPAYYRLGAVRQGLLCHKPTGSRLAIAAFTATANPAEQQTITRVLDLQQPRVFRDNLYRPNLVLRTQRVYTPRGRRQALVKFIQRQGQSAGLVYVRTRKDSEALAQWLESLGFSTQPYHGGLSALERRRIEQAWLGGDLRFVVCTNAFGMGINKPDCRWVIHYQAPNTLSEYVQEVGRAGRDGKTAHALTLASEATGLIDSSDRQRWTYFATQRQQQQRQSAQLLAQLPQQGQIDQVARAFPGAALALAQLQHQGQLDWTDPFHYQLRSPKPQGRQAPPTAETKSPTMADFLNAKQCRWAYLQQAFGFTGQAPCRRCDRCLPK